MALKITFLGAGSSVFARNVLGDCMIHPELEDMVFSLYDIDEQRLEDSYLMLNSMKHHFGKNVISCRVSLRFSFWVFFFSFDNRPYLLI